MECGGGMFSEDEVIVPKCPSCDEELEWLMDSYYCYNCSMSVSKESEVSGAGSSYDDYDEPDYDSMVNNGDEICLDCTYWFVNPHGSAYGMVCRRGYLTDGPGDSCSDFVSNLILQVMEMMVSTSSMKLPGIFQISCITGKITDN